MSADRSVHATTADGEICRYDRAGKWFFEPREGKRRPITVAEAAQLATMNGATVALNLPGGKLFDALVHRARPVQ
ncbi:hypothetical protein [Curtobacterium sp. MCBD17_040]|uniref:hypothetical protein n=1 Tax=Curtobacterium sp. MCBD17_040 TaxID=2175674 RepID=UPI000DA99BC7|nr:hypothetical protein [Curtobacterium sp. MCBD17_040]WIB65385.1 hypothetical protein DEI94_18430 [Curtobacterium sp. MCBD17_040]